MPPEPVPPKSPGGSNAPVNRPISTRPHAPRLPGTYAASFERDMDWHRGVFMLWVLFILIAACEAFYATFILLQGQLVYPLLLDKIRFGVEGTLFLTLWLGWGWTRFPLAAVNFLYGMWQIVWMFGAHGAAPVAGQAVKQSAPLGYGIESIPALAMAGIYIVSAAYLTFSADVLDFERHRREEGRGWVIIPLILLVGAYVAALFNAPLLCLRWLDLEKASALDFTKQTLTAMSTPWNEGTYSNFADPKFLDTWYLGARQQMFVDLTPLGAFQHAGQENVIGKSEENEQRSGFVVTMRCDLGTTAFAHGTAQFKAEVVRTLFGPWKMRGFDMGETKSDTGAPLGTAATPAVAGASPAPVNPPATGPTPGASATASPTPGASVTH